MNWVDVILILIFFLSVMSSMRSGFMIAASDLLCWAASLAIGFLLYKPFSNILDTYISPTSAWSAPAAFMLLFMLSRILLDTLSRRILIRIPEKHHHSTLNKLFGIFPGMLNGFLWLSLAAILFLLLPISSSASNEVQKSKISEWAAGNVNWAQDQLSPVFAGLMNTLVNKQQAAVSHEASIKLNFKVASPQVREDLEAEMLVLVNRERLQHGLKPLKADPETALVSRKHSADMLARGYFSHDTPEGKNPFDRLRAEYVVFRAAGENLALAQTLSTAHQGLMDSPGHRANILRPAFGRLGIGILDAGIYGLMITQTFRN